MKVTWLWLLIVDHDHHDFAWNYWYSIPQIRILEGGSSVMSGGTIQLQSWIGSGCYNDRDKWMKTVKLQRRILCQVELLKKISLTRWPVQSHESKFLIVILWALLHHLYICDRCHCTANDHLTMSEKLTYCLSHYFLVHWQLLQCRKQSSILKCLEEFKESVTWMHRSFDKQKNVLGTLSWKRLIL